MKPKLILESAATIVESILRLWNECWQWMQALGLQGWDSIASIVGGVVLVAGISWKILTHTAAPLRQRELRRRQWRNHLSAVAERAKVMPSDGLDLGATNRVLAKTFVQLAVQPNEPGKAASGPIPSSTPNPVTGDIWDLLAKQEQKVLFVLGRPGMGKTTLVHHIAAELAGLGRYRWQRAIHAHWRNRPCATPFWFRLRDFISEKSDELLIAKLNAELEMLHNLEVPEVSILLLDGLDEVPDLRRPAIAKWINEHAAGMKARWIVTSRPEGFQKPEVTFCSLEVQPLDMPRITTLVQAHFPNQPDMAKTLIDQIRRGETYYQFARNPLLLSMMVDLHRSGQSAQTRVELYRKILLSVLDRRLRDKAMPTELSPDALLSILAAVAWEMGERLELTEPELRRMLERHTFTNIQHQVQAAFHFFPGDFQRREFAHRSFQEYLASTHVPKDDTHILFQRRRAASGDGKFWDETVRFYALLSPQHFVLIFPTLAENHADLLIACGLELSQGEEWTSVRSKFDTWLSGRLDDPTAWKQAAVARLAVRLNSLQPRQNDEVADTSLVTNAEFQLFLDTEAFERYVPWHWSGRRFPVGTGSLPALGVSMAAAIAFCDWLSERDKASAYSLPARFKDHTQLPEMHRYWHYQNGVGACLPRADALAEGRAALGWLAEKFVPVGLAPDLDLDLARALDRALDRDRDRDRALALNRAFNRALDRALDRAHGRAHDVGRAIDRALARALDLAHDVGRALGRAIDRALARALDLDLDLDLDRDLDRALVRARVRALNLDLALDLDRDLALALVRALHLDHHPARVLNLARALDRALDRDLDRALARASDRDFYRDLDFNLDRDLAGISCLFLFVAAVLDHGIEGTPTAVDGWFRRKVRLALPMKGRAELERSCDRFLDLFLQTLILYERRKGNPLFVAFEGIRLVKKRS